MKSGVDAVVFVRGRTGGAHGERVEREPITGVWGGAQRGPGAEPLGGGQG